MTKTQRVKNTLKELIAIRSVSGHERRIQEYIKERFKEIGIRWEEYRVERDRYNLLIRGEEDIMISCHVDTVPPSGMKNPYRAVEREGKIYGRGSSDVKGPLSALVTALEDFYYNRGKVPFYIAFVVDEETNTAIGSENMAKAVRDHVSKCLVLEPTEGRLCTFQRGSLEFTLRVKGEGAHGAEFERVNNPVRELMRTVAIIEAQMGRKLNIIKIRGGTGIYAVPEKAEALLEMKVNRGEDWRDLFDRIQRICKELGKPEREISLEDAENFLELDPAGFFDEIAPIYERVYQREPTREVMESWTDAGNYHKEGISCVIYGDCNLKISHTSREHIEIASLERMVEFFTALFEERI